jgi:hypothetical protein
MESYDNRISRLSRAAAKHVAYLFFVYTYFIPVTPIAAQPLPPVVLETLSEIFSSPVLDIATSVMMAAEVGMDKSLLDRTGDFKHLGYFDRDSACELIVGQITHFEHLHKKGRPQLVMMIVFVRGGKKDTSGTFAIKRGDWLKELPLGPGKNQSKPKDGVQTLEDSQKAVLVHLIAKREQGPCFANIHLSFLTIQEDRPKLVTHEFQLRHTSSGQWKITKSNLPE